MFKVIAAVIASLLLCANAFQLTRTTVSRSCISMVDRLGSVEVNNGKIFDPLSLLTIHEINPGVLPHSKWWQESEIKHCRIAMLASVGAFTGQYGLAIPGYTAVADPVENLNKFIQDWPLGFAQILLAIAVVEGWSDPSEFWWGRGAREAGDLGSGASLFKKKSTAEQDKLRLNELKNGRLAMIAMAAYTAEHWLPGAVPFLPGTF